MPSFNEYWATWNRILLVNKSLVGKERKISPDNKPHTKLSCFASVLHPWWPWLRLLNCAYAWSTMLEERGERLQLRFNIPNILENKRNVEWMLKQSLKAFKLFQHRFNILSTPFNKVERGWQTLSTLPFNKIERMLKQMLKPFARAFSNINVVVWRQVNRKIAHFPLSGKSGDGSHFKPSNKI